MKSIHNINESGYTVKQFASLLNKLIDIDSGMGRRKLMIGPTDGEDGTKPIALPVIGLEANSEYEQSICWIYPGENKWE